MFTQGSIDRHTYVIDPLNMTPLQGYILALFLRQNLYRNNNTTSFSSGVAYPFPHVDHGTMRGYFPAATEEFNDSYKSLRIKYNLKIRPNRNSFASLHQTSDHCYDIYGDNLFLNGMFGPIPEIIGALIFDSYDGGARYTPEVVYTFDPVTMPPQASVIPGAYLQSEFNSHDQKEKIIPAYVKYPIVNKEAAGLKVAPQFMLTHSLMRRRHGHAPSDVIYTIYPDDYCYDVIDEDKLSGEGACSKINPSDFVLQPQSDNSMICKSNENRNKLRLGKRLGLPGKNRASVGDILNEYSINALIAGSSVKHPIFLSSFTSESIMLLRYVKGIELKKLLDANRSNIGERYSVDQRIELFIACLLALRRVHYKGVIHRDIKLENFIIDMTKRPIYATLIDFGLSCKIDKNDKRRFGTPLYAAPEFFEGMFDAAGRLLDPQNRKPLPRSLTQKADIFGLSWVGARIFEADENPSNTYEKARNLALNCVFENLFNGLDTTSERGLSSVEQSTIRNCLRCMSRAAPDERLSVDPLLEEMEILLLKRKLRSGLAEEEDSVQMEQAFRAGMAMRKKLNNLVCWEQNSPGSFFVSIIDEFSSVLNIIADTDAAKTEFINRLDVKFLHGLTDNNAIKQNVEDVVHAYAVNYNEIQEMGKRLKKMRKLPISKEQIWVLQRLDLMVEKQLEKSKMPLTLDDMQMLGYQYGKHLLEFFAEIRRIGLVNEYEQMTSLQNAAPALR